MVPQNLDQEESSEYKWIDMEELKNMALIFIYPDGTVEKIPIGEYKLHIEYMRENLTKSSKFYDICKGLDFVSSCLHGHIDTMLSLNGVIIIFNLDLRDIIEGYFDYLNKIPLLLISCPTNLHSIEQTMALESIYTSYPEDNLVCERFDAKQDVYLGKQYFNIEEYIASAKDSFGSRGV